VETLKNMPITTQHCLGAISIPFWGGQTIEKYDLYWWYAPLGLGGTKHIFYSGAKGLYSVK